MWPCPTTCRHARSSPTDGAGPSARDDTTLRLRHCHKDCARSAPMGALHPREHPQTRSRAMRKERPGPQAHMLAWIASSSAAALAPEISQIFVLPFHSWKVGTARMPCFDMSLFASALLSPITL